MRALTKICLLGCLSTFSLAAAGCQKTDSKSDATTHVALEEWPGTVTLAPESWKVGSDHAEFTLRDEDGAPLEGAQVTVSPWMPAHGHGTTDVELEESDPGVYVTDSLRLNMPGVWELRVQIVRGEEKWRFASTVEVP